MGGIGSGNRWRFGAKSKTGEYRTIDVRHWARDGVLRPGYSGVCEWSRDGKVLGSIQMSVQHDSVRLTYRHRRDDAEWTDEEYSVALTRTTCNFGGSRVWFVCPARGCGRRVAVLYGVDVFACRHCHQLAYSSASDSPGERAHRRAEGIRARLRWKPGIINGHGAKPKWMRLPTFYRLVAEHDRLADQYARETAAKLGILERILGK